MGIHADQAKMARVLLFIMLFAASALAVVAVSAGPNSPGTAVNNASIGTAAWGNPARVKVSDDSRADANLGDNEVSNYVRATNFSFSIPANATVTGIVVDVERQVSSVAGGSIVNDSEVKLVKNGVIQATNRATATAWNTTDVIESHGNATDLWGATWTPAAINNISFGVAVAATKANSAGGNRNARIDHIRITVSYTLPDVVRPNITLIGGNVVLEVGSAYADAGATATDNLQGNITGAINTTSTVNTAVLGTYTVTYTVNDSSGNNASAVVRNVSIVDTTLPAITLIGGNVVQETGTPYTDAGATALDNYNGDITGAISAISTVNTAVLGTYTVTYTVNDSSSNNATPVVRNVSIVDTTPPIITLLGGNIVQEVGTAYADAGATANDNYDSDITGAINTISTVNTAVLGTYTVTYTVNDSSGNNASAVVRNVSIVDTTLPAITLIGGNVVQETGTPYTDAGATALDNYNGDITGAISAISTVNTAVLGTYTVTYTVNDSADNNATPVVRNVSVVDTTAPVITLLGSDPVSVEVGSPYADAGATALDNYDGSLTGSIITVNPVNTAVLGTYTVTYDVNDSSGNAATQVTRTVTVVDTTAPIITLTGSDPVTLEVGTPYVDTGATALDNYDGSLTGSIITFNPVNPAVLGTYTVTYDVSDSSGNPATQVTRTVNVVDTTIPVITVLGADPISVSLGSAYADGGATAADNYDGDITGSIVTVNPVNTAVLGTYTVTYDVTDSSGNPATQATRTVNVVDTDVPIITMLGTSPVTVEVGSAYADAGATALDNADGDITASIVTVNSVNTAVLGSYTVTYDVTDSSGNPAATVTRTVDVVDTTAPIITLTGSDPITLEAGTPYVDAGATAADNLDGNITGSIITFNPVNPAFLGTYTVTYDVTDSAGNPATQVTRTVNVVDTTPPVLTLLGQNPVRLPRFATYAEYGVQASENGTITITGPVDTTVTGTYTVTYTMVDNSGNPATPVTRTVEVLTNHVGLGAKAFSHFSPSAPQGAPDASAALANAPGPAAPAATAANAESGGSIPAPSGTPGPSAGLPAPGNAISGAAAAPQGNGVTGAVTGGAANTSWYWLAALLVLVLALLGGYAYSKNK